MASVGHFGCPKFTLDHISGHLDQYRFFYFVEIFYKMAAGGHFWMSENHFRSHFWSFQIYTQLYFFWKFLTKCLPSAILDVRNSLWITFLAILDQYRFVFKFLTKWLPVAILDVRKSLSISFLSISHRYTTFYFFYF